MAARNSSGAERKRGNVRMRSYISRGMPWIVDAASGEGRTGLDGFVSELKDLTSEYESGTEGAFALLAKVGPPLLCRRIVL